MEGASRWSFFRPISGSQCTAYRREKKAAASDKRVEGCKQKGARTLAETVSPLRTKLLAAEVDVQYHRQLSQVMSGAQASQAAELTEAKSQLAV